MAAAMLFSCGEEKGLETEKQLVIIADKNIIQTSGDYATLTVYYGEDVVTDGVTFFDSNDNVLDLPDFKFSTTAKGRHEIWASYGAAVSSVIPITAVAIKIPEVPSDPNASGKDFKARLLVTEFTGTTCGFCPQMKQLFHTVLSDEAMADKVVMNACHTWDDEDPMYIDTYYDETMKVTGYPTVGLDMSYLFKDYTAKAADLAETINDLVSEKEAAAAGIAVSTVIENGLIVVSAKVKAAVASSYRISAFLLEDGIEADQLNATKDWMDIHDDVIRYIDSENVSYFGHPIGNLNAGDTKDYKFAWYLDDVWKSRPGGSKWDPLVEENLHVCVYVSSIRKNEAGKDAYYVNNVVECGLNASKPFEYR